MKKKLIASVLCVSMLSSLAGCALFDKDDEGVLNAAEDYASAVAGVKVSDIAGLMLNGADLEEAIEVYTSGSEVITPSDWEDMVATIAGTITYEIDSESVTSSKKNAEGSVDITWTLVDCQSVYDEVYGNGGSVDEFIDALGADDAEQISITKTLNLVLEDEAWLVDDEDLDYLYEIYEFYGTALEFVFESPLAPYISEYYWYYSDDSVYSNVDRIELDIIPTEEGSEVEFDFTYEYYYNGELIYTSDEWSDMGYWIEAYYGPDYDPAAVVDENGNLIPGEYRCIMYDLNGIVLADSTCTVETVEYAAGDASMVESVEWYWTDHDDVYVDDDSIELDIIPTSEGQEAIWTFYYEIYLDDELVFTSDICEDQGYWIEAYYSQYYDSSAAVTDDGYLVPGEYTCVMYGLDGSILAESTCTVELS